MDITIRYFAALRDQRGLSSEQTETGARTAAELYVECCKKHGLLVPSKLVRFVANDQFCEPDYVIQPGDTIEFLPPAAGG